MQVPFTCLLNGLKQLGGDPQGASAAPYAGPGPGLHVRLRSQQLPGSSRSECIDACVSHPAALCRCLAGCGLLVAR